MAMVELDATRKEVVVTDFQTLQTKIRESGITMVALAKKTGILRETLYNRLAGKGDFTAREMMALADALNLSHSERDAIFFANKVE